MNNDLAHETDREPDSVSDGASARSATPPLRVVGLGGSAGAVRALQAFFEALPADSGMAFIVVLHLSPEHQSYLPDILSRATEMPVVQVVVPIEMEPDHVYVIPPGRNLVMRDGWLDLTEFDEPRGRRMPVDVFFRSHAETHPDGVAIVLTGGGSDGSVGVTRLKEAGALVMAQDPEEAEHDSMPRSAIATGAVDVVAPVRELAEAVVAYHRRGTTDALPGDPDDLDGDDGRAVQRILGQLQAWTEHDFSGYKRTTLLRRIARRMHVVGARTLSEYFEVLHDDGDEADALFRDLLISVTSFFRDPEAWEALAEHVVPGLFEGRGPGDTVRVWAPGCATGEEAYSLAIVLAEHAETLDRPPGFQVFATDLDDQALSRARVGLYPEAIREDVSPERLDRFFEADDGHYRIGKTIRARVLFAPHNLLRDPPFSTLDLVVCRNLLIYLQRDLQRYVFAVFQYALKPGGTLFLGSAESIDGEGRAFEPVDKGSRLYRRRASDERSLRIPRLPFAGVVRGQAETVPRPVPASAALSVVETHLDALDTFGPPSLLVDEHGQILHLSTGASRYLVYPPGRISADVTKVIHPALRSELRTALYGVFERGEASSSRPTSLEIDGEDRLVHLIVRPAGEDSPRRALVLVAEVDRVETDVARRGRDARRPRPPARGRASADARAAPRDVRGVRDAKRGDAGAQRGAPVGE